MTATDWILYNVIGLVFTPDEWHAFVTGLMDGASFKKQGKWSRKAAEKMGVQTKKVSQGNKWDLIEDLKPWYYNLGYQTGEYGKIGLALAATSVLGMQCSALLP